MSRVFIIVIDSFGPGEAPDATILGDSGADSLGLFVEQCTTSKADVDGFGHGPQKLPNPTRLGLGRSAMASAGIIPIGHRV